MRRYGLVLAIASALMLSLSGCITIQSASVDSISENAPEPTITKPPLLPTPQGFTRSGEVAFRWVESGTVPCTVTGCVYVDVFARDECPDGVFFEANLYEDRTYTLILETTSGTLAGVTKGQTGRIELPFTKDGWVRLASTGCL